jgi:hypothetical protein
MLTEIIYGLIALKRNRTRSALTMLALSGHRDRHADCIRQ